MIRGLCTKARDGVRGISLLRGLVISAAVAVLLMTAGLSASQPSFPRDEGERFGEIHWYEPQV